MVSRRTFCCSILPALGCARAASKPDFTGAWKLNPAKSKLEITPPDSSMFYIDHREPRFHLKRTHVFDGKPNTWGIELIVGGPEVVQNEGTAYFHVRLRWEDDVLLFDSYWIDGDAKATNLVRYTLSQDGAVFTADERVTAPDMHHHNIWVFDRDK